MRPGSSRLRLLRGSELQLERYEMVLWLGAVALEIDAPLSEVRCHLIRGSVALPNDEKSQAAVSHMGMTRRGRVDC